MNNPRFILGIGCQKGGTTWLHDYLTRHPNVDMGFMKEYHIFDGLFIPELQNLRHAAFERARFFMTDEKFLRAKKGRNVLKRLDFFRDIENYFDYFQYLYLKSYGKVSLVGDITPSYSALPSKAFSLIRDGLISRGFQPRVVFLLRDPVERCWSAVRMGRRKRTERNPKLAFDFSEEAAVLKYALSYKAEMRTRYDITLKKVEGVFARNEVYVGFFETFFNKNSILNLSEFLGIDYNDPNFGMKSNQSHKESIISVDAKKQIINHYGEVYEWAFNRYGEDFIKSIWDSANYC